MALAQIAQTIISDLWQSLGSELIIFAMTLLCTVIIRRSNGKPAGPKKSPKIVTDTPRRQPAPHSGRCPASARADRAKAPSGDASKLPASQPAAKVGPAKLEPWQVVDEVVKGMKDQPTAAFCARSLKLHAQLRAVIQELDVTLSDAVTCARRPLAEYYVALVQCALRVGKPQYISEIVDDMAKQGVKRPLAFYESVMKQLAGQKHYALALSMYDRLVADGLEPSAVTCSCLVSFAADLGEYDRAATFFEKLKSIATPSIRAYMTVLRVHAKREDWKAALATFRDMQSRKVPLDSLVLNVVLATGVATDQIEGIVDLLEEADSYDPPLSDVVSYNTVIKGHAARGDIAAAMQAIGRMRQRGLMPNAITFNTAIDAAVRGARSDDAWKLMEEMRQCRLRPDKFTCSILVKGLTKHPKPERIGEVLSLLRKVGTTCDMALLNTMYHMLLEAASLVEGNEALMHVYSQMRQHKVLPTTLEYQLVARALHSESDNTWCRELLQQALGEESGREWEWLKKLVKNGAP